jgi:hypothetical protein
VAKKTSGTVFKRVPADVRRAYETMRRYRGAGQGTDIHRRYLYRWPDQLEPAETSEGPPPQNSPESTLRKEVSQLKRVLAEKTLELDFFKGALQKSGRDASRKTALARRHLRPNPGSDVLARQLEYRTDVSTGPS